MVKLKPVAMIVIILSTLISLFGVYTSADIIVNQFEGPFYLPLFLAGLMYLIAFGFLTAYSLKSGAKSVINFKVVIFTYAMVILLFGLLFPPSADNIWTGILTRIFSLCVLISLFAFDARWYDMKFSKMMLTNIYFLEVLLALAYIWTGKANELPSSQLVMYWMRPIIASSLAVCYLYRMYEKEQDKKDKEKES